MKIEGKHISLLGLGVTSITAIIGILYYRNQAANNAAQADQNSGLGSFPYFQSAALPSSATGVEAGGVAAAGGGSTSSFDLNALATTQADLQGHISDNALQNDWVSFLSGNTNDIINSLSTAGYGTGGISASVTQKPGGGFFYNIGSTIVKGSPQATNSSPVINSILPPSAYSPLLTTSVSGGSVTGSPAWDWTSYGA